jgi:hypothetical protein
MVPLAVTVVAEMPTVNWAPLALLRSKHRKPPGLSVILFEVEGYEVTISKLLLPASENWR